MRVVHAYDDVAVTSGKDPAARCKHCDDGTNGSNPINNKCYYYRLLLLLLAVLLVLVSLPVS